MQGWVKLHRCLMNKPIWTCTTPEQKAILITLLMMANHKEKEWIWKGERYVCNSGEFTTSLESIANKSGTSMQNVRTALKNFEKKYDFLTSQSTNKNRLITIKNWGKYQSEQDDLTSNLTSNQQATNKQLTTNKNVKNVKEEYIDEFETLWQLYPNKKGKSSAMKKYPSLRSKYSFEDLQRAVKKYADEVKGQDAKYIKHGSTFFNGGYLDYIEAEKPKKVVKLTPRFEDYLGNGSV